MNEQLLEPLKYYRDQGKALHEQNTKEFFDDLLQQSGINAEENRSTVRTYDKTKEEIKKVEKKISWLRVLKGFLIFLTIVGFVFMAIGILMCIDGSLLALGIVAIVLGLLSGVGFIILTATQVTPRIKNASRIKETLEDKANELLAKAWAQMAPLNALFNDTDALRLAEKTIPGLKFDMRFERAREDFFVRHNDFIDLGDSDCSMTNTLSGNFCGNPFVFCRRLIHKMGLKTYFGSRTIFWTETYRDSQGNLRRRTRSQTLHASVTKPKPEYHPHSYLCYGSQAAPDLTFTRKPTHAEDLSERELARKIKRGEKKLSKKAQAATEKGGNFQEMANSEFDVLFGATDRNHEVQFRLMVTPLAQRNMVDLIKDDDNGYGDDFHFNKYKRCNIITSEHAQKWNMNTTATNYYSYHVDTARSKFINFNSQFFRSVFFDFAPLFSIPAYMEEPSSSLEPYDNSGANYTVYEHEVMANAIGYKSFVHPASDTVAILKTKHSARKENADVVSVTAYSYQAVQRVDQVLKMGGDGNLHHVPVPWIEYIPVQKTTNMLVQRTDMTERDVNEAKKSPDGRLSEGKYFHGMVAYCMD